MQGQSNSAEAPVVAEMSGIVKTFPGVRALDGAQLTLRAGEVHALMGENGAGKSTLIKVLAGIYQKDGGEVRLHGDLVSFDTPRAAQEAGICVIHQELSIVPHLTVAQNIFLGREPRTALGLLDEAALNARAEKILASMNLDIHPKADAGNLTVARQQMVEIAKALAVDGRVLVMDEPTAPLNDREVAELFTIIRGLKAQGVAIVYISHRMAELPQIADRVTVMRDGAWIGTVGAEAPVSEIIEMMVGRKVEVKSPDIPDLSNAPVLLRAEGLKVGRRVRDVSFEVRAGEILGFAGLMGAGRTETARLIFGADAREAGRIVVHGREVDIRSPADAVAAGIGYLSEDRRRFGLAIGLSVAENVALADLGRFARAGIVNGASIRQTAREMIGKLRVRTPHENQEARLLSGGNQQKVVIAKWLLRECDVLFFDEPTRGIDVGAKSEIYDLLRNLAAQGKAIVVISSELPELLQLSHRIAVMCEGRLTGVLPGGPRTTQAEIMALATAQATPILEGVPA
ncbi:MAG: sugar ABC transporter ATP-binding protein [Pseudomonadota bacterium]